MCGIVGVVAKSPVNQMLYESLGLLQHRGQDAAGIATCDDGKLFMRKSLGLVRDVFRTSHMLRLQGCMGIGHVRYPTAGSTAVSAEAQPLYVNSPYGITLGHNGNLTNAAELKESMFNDDLRHINTSSDSEILLNVFAHELQSQVTSTYLTPEQLFAAIEAVYKRIRGGYAVVGMLVGRGVFAFRDPHGIRPIVYGSRKNEQGEDEYMVASENVVLEAMGFEVVRDLQPGEAMYFEANGKVHFKQCVARESLSPCLFEFVYFARPDSVIDGLPVYQTRVKMGEKLAKKIMREWGDHDIDVVIPIPESSRPAALELSKQLNVDYREGLIKNRYIGRTFIMPGQTQRRKSVRQKLNPIPMEFEGRNVLLVDDSIVRGTTSEQIVQMARDAGARKVYLASAAPPVRHPNVYGIDMPTPKELIAHERDNDGIRQAIGCDRLIYQDLIDLIDSSRLGSDKVKSFESSCFTGEYITGDVDKAYLDALDKQRNDAAKGNQSNQLGESESGMIFG